MGWNKGKLTQPFKIEVDVEKLMEHITDQVLKNIAEDKEIDSVEIDEWYVEDTNLVIDGSYDAYFKSIYTPATRYEPSDYEEERPCISDTDGEWMLYGLPEEIKKLVSIYKVTEDMDKCDQRYWGQEDIY